MMNDKKKMKATCWLLTAVAAMIMPLLLASCSSVEQIDDEALEPKAEWHFAINADRNNDVESRALTEKTDRLQFTWDPSYDIVYVYNKTQGYLQSTSYLEPGGTGTSTTLEGTFDSGKYAVGDELMLLLNYSISYGSFNYVNQTGELNYISKFVDCAIADVTVTEIDGSDVKTTRAQFKNQQSIFKLNFTFQDKPLKVKSVKVEKEDGKLWQRYNPFDDSRTYNRQGEVTAEVDEATDDIWVALRNESPDADTYTFTVTDEYGGEYVGVKEKGFDIGKFYTATIPVESTFDPLTTPLTVEAKEDATITIENPFKLTIQYSLNDGEKTSGSDEKIEIKAAAGDMVQLYGDNSAYAKSYEERTSINFSAPCYVYGNVMSLVSSTAFAEQTTVEANAFRLLFNKNTNLLSHPTKRLTLPATSLADYCYVGMFYGCKSLEQAPALPATTLAYGCYDSMFSGCTSLTQAPELPATTLTEYCYNGMFDGCTSLEQAPALPATTLAKACYYSMFYGCTSLTQAPVLPATTLTESCYRFMFYNCSKLSKVTCYAMDISAEGCTTDWLLGVSATGEFIHAKGVTSWTAGASGIPVEWSTTAVTVE